MPIAGCFVQGAELLKHEVDVDSERLIRITIKNPFPRPAQICMYDEDNTGAKQWVLPAKARPAPIVQAGETLVLPNAWLYDHIRTETLRVVAQTTDSAPGSVPETAVATITLRNKRHL